MATHGWALVIDLTVAAVVGFVLLMLLIGCAFTAADVPPTALRRVRLKWEPRDLWIGCYWTRDPVVRIYLCFVPFLVLIFEECQPSRGQFEDRDGS